MTKKKTEFGSMVNMATKGMGAILGPIILGWVAGQALDRHFNHAKPWVSVVLLSLGAVTGLYSTVKMAISKSK